jgi:hypothetical protein
MWARKLAPWAETVCSLEETKVVEKALVAGVGKDVSLVCGEGSFQRDVRG